MAYTKQLITNDKFMALLDSAVDAVVSQGTGVGVNLRNDSAAIEAALEDALDGILEVSD